MFLNAIALCIYFFHITARYKHKSLCTKCLHFTDRTYGYTRCSTVLPYHRILFIPLLVLKHLMFMPFFKLLVESFVIEWQIGFRLFEIWHYDWCLFEIWHCNWCLFDILHYDWCLFEIWHYGWCLFEIWLYDWCMLFEICESWHFLL